MLTEAQRRQRRAHLDESNKRAAEHGVPPLDESRMQPDCAFEKFCSPYIEQPWAHDERCPLGSRRRA